MKFGFGIPTRGRLATPEIIVELAQYGETRGFDVLSVSDHLIIPRNIESRYPYNETGQFAGSTGECPDQLTLLAYLAGQTVTISLLTSVMVVPHRSPVHTAKILATTDVLSRGRLIVGCGAGWMREEFEALGAPPFERRGAVTREYIRIFKELWTSEDPSFHGEFASFADVIFEPKPFQKPHPPIWTGGESAPALRRAGELADAWYPIGNNPRFPMDTPNRLREGFQRVREYADKAGRDPASVKLAYSAGWYNERSQEMGALEGRRIFTGAPEQIAEDIRAFEEIGVGHLMLSFQAGSASETKERMDYFMKEIASKVG